MMSTIGALADRLLLAVAPKADAGACPCGDTYCSSILCGPQSSRTTLRIRTNCNCEQVAWNCNCN